MMHNLTILHLSDLHFCPSKQRDIDIVKKALFSDLENMKSKGVQPDIVVFSGDLIFAGDYGYSDERSDYEDVERLFVNPLLELLGLDADNFFICPGNHDVQQSAVDEYLEDGLRQRLVDKQSVNRLVDNFESHAPVFSRLQYFERFRQRYGGAHRGTSNVLFSTYVIERGSHKIGIACVNSAWRAFGGEPDYGQLLIGERTIDACTEDLKDCDLRIGVVHHPFECLKEFERVELKRLVCSSFHIWLHGHTHEQESALVQTANENRIVIIAGGALYKSREFYNGYSLIENSCDKHSGLVYLRTYNDRARCFVPASEYGEEGTFEFAFPETTMAPLGRNMPVIARIRSSSDTVNEVLLPAALEHSVAPKELRRIFVEPVLATESEFKYSLTLTEQDRDKLLRGLDTILDSEANLLIIGKSESGKTTLLSYLWLAYLEPERMEGAKVPFLFSLKDLPKGKDRIKKAIHASPYHQGEDIDLERILLQGDCVLLIDDLDLRDRKALKSLVRFTTDYPDNRYVIAMDEDMFADLEIDEPPSLGIEYEKLYIHPFGRRQTRELVDKWFQDTSTQVNPAKLSEDVLLTIAAIHLPRTPMTISMILSIIEQEPSYAPLNKASLIARLTQILLDQSWLADASRAIDCRTKEDLLSYLAYYMVLKEENQLHIDELTELTIDYFNAKALPIPGGAHRLLENLIRCGILARSNDEVRFRFDCFREFFTAKRMIEDKAFYKETLRKDTYLDFTTQLEYLTGLVRKNEDLVKLLSQRTEASLGSFLQFVGLDVQPQHFDSFDVHRSILDALSSPDRQAVVDRLRKSVLDEETKDSLLDVVLSYQDEEHEDQQTTPEDTYAQLRTLLLKNLALHSTVVRNCQLIDDRQLKTTNVELCLRAYLQCLYISILKDRDWIENVGPDDLLDLLPSDVDPKLRAKCKEWANDPSNINNLRELLKDRFQTMHFLIAECIITASLGTPQLQIVLEGIIDDQANPVALRLLAVLLYTDCRLPRYLDKVEGILKDIVGSRYYTDIMSVSLFCTYTTEDLAPGERRRMENILADLAVAQAGVSRRYKSLAIGAMSKLRSSAPYEC